MIRHAVFILITSLAILAFGGCDNKEDGNITILENGYYFNGDSMVAFQELTIQGSKIASISNKQGKQKGRRVKLHGKYVIPGLTDAHVHLLGSPTRSFELAGPEYNAASSLRCGVTTVIDLFFDESRCAVFKRNINSCPEKYATVILSGPMLTAPNGHGTEYGVETRTITTVAEAQRITNQVIDNGIDVIKLVYEAYSGKYAITKEILDTIVATAHKRQVKVFAHIAAAREVMDCVDAGVDVLAHMPNDSLTPEQLNRMGKSGILTIPTMSVYKSMYEGQDAGFMSDSLLWQTAHPAYLSKFKWNKKTEPPYPAYKILASGARSNLKLLIAGGLPIVAGTDAGNYAVFCGYSLHDELLEYVKAGMAPAEALNSATKTIQSIFPQNNTGIIGAGYDADLVILNKNPLKDIRNTKSIAGVFHKGLEVGLQ